MEPQQRNYSKFHSCNLINAKEIVVTSLYVGGTYCLYISFQFWLICLHKHTLSIVWHHPASSVDTSPRNKLHIWYLYACSCIAIIFCIFQMAIIFAILVTVFIRYAAHGDNQRDIILHNNKHTYAFTCKKHGLTETY